MLAKKTQVRKRKTQPPKRRTRRRAQGKSKIITERKGPQTQLRGTLYNASVASSIVVSTNLSISRFKIGKVEGSRLNGMFPMASIKYVETEDKKYVGNCIYPMTDPVNVYYGLPINPSWLFTQDSREFYESFPYGQFKFTKLRLIYVAQCASSNQASIGISYYPDVTGGIAFQSTPPAFATVITMPNSITCPVWTSGVSLDASSQLPQNWFYVDDTNNSNVASDIGRLQEQGFWTAQFGSTAGLVDGQTVGIVYVDYTVELIEARYALNVDDTLSSSPGLRKRESKNKRRQYFSTRKAVSLEADSKESGDAPSEGPEWGSYPTVSGGGSLPPRFGSSGSVLDAGALSIGSQAHLQGEPSGWITTEEDEAEKPQPPVVVPRPVKAAVKQPKGKS